MTRQTVRVRYPTGNLTLGVDGYVPRTNAVFDDGCCADTFCTSFCDTACAFVDLLPTGPMWDRQKAEALRTIEECGGELQPNCPSLALYAVYGARVLYDMRNTILKPAIMESRPETAKETLDDWLERYGWQDCYKTFCRSDYLAMFSPYEVEGGCGTEYCEAVFGVGFECALKHAILLSLKRMQRGVIKNLDGINWVIAPLGAALSPKRWPTRVNKYLSGACPEEPGEAPPCFCDEVEFEICQFTDEIPGCPIDICQGVANTESTLQLFSCNGGPFVEVYPSVVAAECIVRAMMLNKCPNVIYRCDAATPVQPPIG